MSRNARLPVTIVKYGGNDIIVNIKKGTGFQLSIRQLKPRLSLCPITKDMDNRANQSKLEQTNVADATSGKTSFNL